MPSLHFGWNLLMGIALVRESRHRALHLVGWLTPAVMMFAMVVTANHYLLDAAAGAAVVLVALLAVEVVPPPSSWLRRWRTARLTGPLIESDPPPGE